MHVERARGERAILSSAGLENKLGRKSDCGPNPGAKYDNDAAYYRIVVGGWFVGGV